ncbi:hypothetical protein ACJX0J_029522, partial [Zea mays]
HYNFHVFFCLITIVLLVFLDLLISTICLSNFSLAKKYVYALDYTNRHWHLISRSCGILNLQLEDFDMSTSHTLSTWHVKSATICGTI